MKQFFIKIIVFLLSIIRKISHLSEYSFKILFIPGFEKTRWMIGKWKAWIVFLDARKRIPAYKDFLKEKGFIKNILPSKHLNPNFNLIPITNKKNYIQKYSIEQRCKNGELPLSGVMIDESSGSSGKPNNWVRGKEERKSVKEVLQFAFHRLLGKEQIIVLNAFALGPWATGMNVSMSVVDISILKSTGPDIDKIINTLKLFGNKYRYLVMGYPPFLKSLSDDPRIDWDKYNISAVFGGEGISEGMRSYLLKKFDHVYSSYGASDLEINIASENEFTVNLRRLIKENRELASDIVKIKNGVTPMIFQYNPLDYYIESNKESELIVTVCRKKNLSHRVRYNIHDTGHVIRHQELIKILNKHSINEKNLGLDNDLPLLFHYGRSDLSVAYYGCKITPSNIEEILFEDTDIAEKIYSFSLLLSEDENSNKKLEIAIEHMEGIDSILINEKELTEILISSLKEKNQDFKESIKMVAKEFYPKVKYYKYKEGPFKNTDIRVKMKYIQ